jgi:membrane protease subunit HflC
MKPLARPKTKMNYIYIILAIVMSAFVLYQESLYKVKKDDQVVITQFSEVFGEANTETGVYFKIPFIQKAHYYPKNTQLYKHEHEIPTLNKKLIRFNTQAVWKLDDSIKFYNRLYYFDDNAKDFIQSKIRTAERNIIAATKISDIVFKSNDTTTENLECNPEVLHRIKKEAQLNLLEFGILLLNIKATVTCSI